MITDDQQVYISDAIADLKEDVKHHSLSRSDVIDRLTSLVLMVRYPENYVQPRLDFIKEIESLEL